MLFILLIYVQSALFHIAGFFLNVPLQFIMLAGQFAKMCILSKSTDFSGQIWLNDFFLYFLNSGTTAAALHAGIPQVLITTY